VRERSSFADDGTGLVSTAKVPRGRDRPRRRAMKALGLAAIVAGVIVILLAVAGVTGENTRAVVLGGAIFVVAGFLLRRARR
jgi:ferric-dicitrate binding protein FerR (iron transport regulator)